MIQIMVSKTKVTICTTNPENTKIWVLRKILELAPHKGYIYRL